MTTPTLFKTWRPREEILNGAVADADLTGELASIVARPRDSAYGDPARIFADTYPTRGVRNLLENVWRRLSGAGGEVAAMFGVDTGYRGGK